MAKYRKKPVVIEATQWFKLGDHPDVRKLSLPPLPQRRICKGCGLNINDHGQVHTLEGVHIVCPGDWIITGVKGEKYPCKPDIFEMTYNEMT